MSYRNTRKIYSWVFPAWLLLPIKLRTSTGCSKTCNYIALAMSTQFSAVYYRVSGWPSGLRRCVQVAVYSCRRGFESHSWHNFFFFSSMKCFLSEVFFLFSSMTTVIFLLFFFLPIEGFLCYFCPLKIFKCLLSAHCVFLSDHYHNSSLLWVAGEAETFFVTYFRYKISAEVFLCLIPRPKYLRNENEILVLPYCTGIGWKRFLLECHSKHYCQGDLALKWILYQRKFQLFFSDSWTLGMRSTSKNQHMKSDWLDSLRLSKHCRTPGSGVWTPSFQSYTTPCSSYCRYSKPHSQSLSPLVRRTWIWD